MRTLTKRQVIGTMFGFLSNDSAGYFRNMRPRRRTETLSSPPKAQQQVIGTMFGFLSKNLTQTCSEGSITSGLAESGRYFGIENSLRSTSRLTVTNQTATVRWINNAVS